jgi:acetyl esterase/lipase
VQPDDVLSRPQPAPGIRIAYGSDPNQFGDLRLPAVIQGKSQGPFPVVMNIHGGFWRAQYDLMHASHLCAAFTKIGIATWNLEYRRAGNPGGGWPGTFEDITSGYRFVKQLASKHHLDPKRVIVMGHSAGGHLAVALAGHQPDLLGVVSLAGVLDLRRAWELHLSNDAVVEFLGGTPQAMPDHYREADPMQLSVKARQEILHGTDDDTVPFEIGRKYVETKRALREQVALRELPKTGHFELIDPESAAWKTVEASVKSLLS